MLAPVMPFSWYLSILPTPATPHHSIKNNASHSWNTSAEHLQGWHRSLPHLKDEKVALRKVIQVGEIWGVISTGCDGGPGGGEF